MQLRETLRSHLPTGAFVRIYETGDMAAPIGAGRVDAHE